VTDRHADRYLQENSNLPMATSATLKRLAQRETQTERQRYRRTDRQIQTYMQTDRHADRHRHRHAYLLGGPDFFGRELTFANSNLSYAEQTCCFSAQTDIHTDRHMQTDRRADRH
jgi:hypothetical protein